MKITGLSHLFKWQNLHNWWLTKYFFAPLYVRTPSLRCSMCLIEWSVRSSEDVFRSEVEMG